MSARDFELARQRDDLVAQIAADGAQLATSDPLMTQATDTFDDKAVARAIETLQAKGFGVLTNTDVDKNMKKMLDAEGRSYRILAANNPPLHQHRAPTAEPKIVMLLPNNLFVREEADGHITVGLMNPVVVLRLVDNLANGEIVQQVRGRLVEVCDKLAVS
jgi:uncharacterized protein (DUF302 family)